MRLIVQRNAEELLKSLSNPTHRWLAPETFTDIILWQFGERMALSYAR